MPEKMSIEVVKHSDTDYRLIFKNDKCSIRKTFNSVDDISRSIFFNMYNSSVFDKARFFVTFGK
jgi:hypothetical protein